MSEYVAARTIGRSHRIEAEVEIPAGGAEGMLLSQGNRFGGYALYIKGGKLVYTYNFLGLDAYTIRSSEDVPAGKATLGFACTMTGPGQGRGALFINGKPAGEGALPRMAPITFGLGYMLTCGEAAGPGGSATPSTPPFRFTGTLRKVTVRLE